MYGSSVERIVQQLLLGRSRHDNAPERHKLKNSIFFVIPTLANAKAISAGNFRGPSPIGFAKTGPTGFEQIEDLRQSLYPATTTQSSISVFLSSHSAQLTLYIYGGSVASTSVVFSSKHKGRLSRAKLFAIIYLFSRQLPVIEDATVHAVIVREKVDARWQSYRSEIPAKLSGEVFQGKHSRLSARLTGPKCITASHAFDVQTCGFSEMSVPDRLRYFGPDGTSRALNPVTSSDHWLVRSSYKG